MQAEYSGLAKITRILKPAILVNALLFAILTINYPMPVPRENIAGSLRYYGFAKKSSQKPIPTMNRNGGGHDQKVPDRSEGQEAQPSFLTRYLEGIRQQKAVLTHMFAGTQRQKIKPKCEKKFLRILQKLDSLRAKGLLTKDGADIIADKANNALYVNDETQLDAMLASLGKPGYEKQVISSLFEYRSYVIVDSHIDHQVSGIVTNSGFTAAVLFDCPDTRELPVRLVKQIRIYDLSRSNKFKIIYFSLLVSLFVIMRINAHIVCRLDALKVPDDHSIDTVNENRRLMKLKLSVLHLRKQAVKGDFGTVGNISGGRRRRWFFEIPKADTVITMLIVMASIFAMAAWHRYLNPPAPFYDGQMSRFVAELLDSGVQIVREERKSSPPLQKRR